MDEQAAPEAGPDPDGLAWDLHRLAVAIAAFDVVVGAELGVSAGDYLAIKHVLAADGPVGPVELGRLLGMSSGSATTLVDRLERDGHLQRGPHPSDGRRRIVTVSDTAREQVLQALAPLAVAIDCSAGQLDLGERAAVRRFLADAAQAHDRQRPVAGDRGRAGAVLVGSVRDGPGSSTTPTRRPSGPS